MCGSTAFVDLHGSRSPTRVRLEHASALPAFPPPTIIDNLPTRLEPLPTNVKHGNQNSHVQWSNETYETCPFITKGMGFGWKLGRDNEPQQCQGFSGSVDLAPPSLPDFVGLRHAWNGLDELRAGRSKCCEGQAGNHQSISSRLGSV